MILNITWSEEKVCETLVGSTDEQLQYNLGYYNSLNGIENVKFFFFSIGSMTVSVNTEFLLTATLNEMAFRELL